MPVSCPSDLEEDFPWGPYFFSLPSISLIHLLHCTHCSHHFTITSWSHNFRYLHHIPDPYSSSSLTSPYTPQCPRCNSYLRIPHPDNRPPGPYEARRICWACGMQNPFDNGSTCRGLQIPRTDGVFWEMEVLRRCGMELVEGGRVVWVEKEEALGVEEEGAVDIDKVVDGWMWRNQVQMLEKEEGKGKGKEGKLKGWKWAKGWLAGK